MKRYFNKKLLFIFIGCVLLATLLSAYLNSCGYQGMLYFQTVYEKNGYRTYGAYSPRTGAFMMTGITIFYLAFSGKRLTRSKGNHLVNRIIGTFLILGVTIFVIGVLDLANAIIYLLNR